MKAKKKKAAALAILVLLAGAGIFAYGWLGKPNGLVLYGNIDQRQVELAFIDSERISQVLVEEGDIVEPGQVVACLETRRLRDRIAVLEAEALSAEAALLRLKNGTRPEEIEQARAALAAAQAEVDFAQQDYKRFSSIYKTSGGAAVSKQDVDDARMRLNVAQASLRSEKEALTLAQTGPRWEDIAEAEAVLQASRQSLREYRNMLDDAQLKSPGHSVVRSRLLEPGDMASPQRPVFSLAVISPKWVRAYIAESDLGRVKPGADALVYVDSAPGQGIAGKVGFISSIAEFTPKTVETAELRTALVYEIRVYVRDEDDSLRLGMPATVRFPDL